MALTAEEILAAVSDRAAEVVAVPAPEWGGDVLIRRVSADELKRIGFFRGDAADLPLKLLGVAIANPDGSPAFTKEQLRAFARADFAVIVRLFNAAAKINGIHDADVDEATEDFAQAQDEDSSSD